MPLNTIRRDRIRRTHMACAKVKPPLSCRSGLMRRSILLGASTPHGSVAKIAPGTVVNQTPCARSNSIRAGSRALRGWRPSATCWCSIGWIRPGATSCCNRRAITPSGAARLRFARRCGPIRSRPRWCGSSRSKAISSRSSVSIVSTIRRSSTSSPILRQRIRCPMRRSAGTPSASVGSGPPRTR